MSADDVEDLLGDDADIDLPETAWWPAAEPLPTVVALESACTKEDWKERDAVVADLKSFRRVLESAVALDLRVRFAFDV